MLTGKIIDPFNIAVAGEPHFNGKFDCLFVEHGQGTGMGKGNRAYVGIGLRPKDSTIPAKQFCLRQQLRMDFKPDDYFIFTVDVVQCNVKLKMPRHDKVHAY